MTKQLTRSELRSIIKETYQASLQEEEQVSGLQTIADSELVKTMTRAFMGFGTELKKAAMAIISSNIESINHIRAALPDLSILQAVLGYAINLYTKEQFNEDAKAAWEALPEDVKLKVEDLKKVMEESLSGMGNERKEELLDFLTINLEEKQ